MNVFFLLAGFLSVLISIAHALWGEKQIFNRLRKVSAPEEIKTSLYVPWHQITFILLLSGVGLISVSFFNDIYFLSAFILILIVGNLLTFILICLSKKQTELLTKSIPQFILFSLLIILITLGIVFK